MIRRAVTIEVDRTYLEHLRAKSAANNGRGEVVLALRRPGGKVLVSTKHYYPNGIFRLPSGAINAIESPEEAFLRETWEETSLKPEIQDQIATLVHHCTNGDASLDIKTQIFLGSFTSDEPVPVDTSERIRAYAEVGPDELIRIADHLRSLFGRWEGFGKFRATAHEVVAEYLSRR